jgi:hypothetical protein
MARVLCVCHTILSAQYLINCIKKLQISVFFNRTRFQRAAALSVTALSNKNAVEIRKEKLVPKSEPEVVLSKDCDKSSCVFTR